MSVAQLPLTYETISTAKGLSQGYIFDILQDKDGFLWFTTKAGLNRYDGYSFKVYAYNAFDSHSISSNATLHLFEDSKGRIWIGTEDNGLSIFDKKKDWFHRILHNPNDPNSLSSSRANTQITEMADGRFLVNASEKYFDLITIPDDFFEKEATPKIEHIFKPMDCYDQIIYTDAQKLTWFNCGGRQYQFFANKNKFEFVEDYKLHFNGVINTKEGLWLNDERISELDNNISYPTFSKDILHGQGCFFLKEANKRLWISISNLKQLQVYDLSKWKRNQTLNPEECLIAEDKNVGSMKLLKDRTGLVWVGLNGHGIRKYSFESEKFNHKARDFSVKKILISKQNDIYLQSWATDKILTVAGDLLDNEWIVGKRDVLSYFISKSGDLWLTIRKDAKSEIISELEQIDLVTGKNKRFKVVMEGDYRHDQQIMEDLAGNLWIGGSGGAFAVFNPATGATKEYSLNIDPTKAVSENEFITAFYEDNAGIVWVGTNAGFVKLESKSILAEAPKITWYRTESRNENSLNDGHVSSFLDDPLNNNLLWISTKGGGLNLMEKSTGKITHITTLEGLCNDVVYGILPDEMGNIWGSTNNGLFCILANKIRNKNFEIRHFTEVAGLQAAEFNTGAFAKFPNGYLAFGGINGINVFNPKEILIDSFAPNIFITKLLVNNKQVKSGDETGLLGQAIEFTKKVSLNYRQDEFTLEFSSLDFRAPDQNKYRYQLAGIDKEWVESGNRRTANYVHLPAGTYVFKVQGSNSQGIWSDKVAELTIVVTPPLVA